MIDLYFDLETLPDQSEGALERVQDEIQAPANYKDPVKIEAYKADKAVSAYEKTALDGLYGEICSIAWAVGDGEVIANCRDIHTSEKWLIQHFMDCIEQETTKRAGAIPMLKWIGHNILDFDLPYLWKRCVILGILPPFLIPKNARPTGSDHVYDTMREWEGYRGYVSQKSLVAAFGMDVQESDGSMVWEQWQAEEYDKIRQHNMDDVREVREIYKRMQAVLT